MPRDIRELWYGERHAHRCRFQGRRLQPRDVHRTRRVDQAVRGVVVTDDDAPLQFLRRAFHPDDWVAVFLKSYESGRIAQRVAPVSVVMSSPCQTWLARENETAVNGYFSVNTIQPPEGSPTENGHWRHSSRVPRCRPWRARHRGRYRGPS